MNSTTVRVSKECHRALRALAEAHQTTIGEFIERTVRRIQRQQLLEETNRAYAALRADDEAWAELEDERRLWDTTLSDGVGE